MSDDIVDVLENRGRTQTVLPEHDIMLAAAYEIRNLRVQLQSEVMKNARAKNERHQLGQDRDKQHKYIR